MKYKVSVVVPVYGAERYIERCARSLFEQTLREVEYVFVDDCTPDASMDVLRHVLDDYPDRRAHVRFLRTERNSGQAEARRLGMVACNGEYMIHCDPDDWIDAEYYEKLFCRAHQADADICTGAIILHTSNGEYMQQNASFDGLGMDAMIERKYYWSLCTQIIRRSLLVGNDIYPYEGINSGEDVNVVMRAYALARRVVSLDDSMVNYHYNRTNPASISKSRHSDMLERYFIRNAALLDQFFEPYGSRGKEVMLSYKARAKGAMLYDRDIRDIDKWYKVWPEVTDYYRRHPEIYGVSSRLVPLARHCHWLLKLYFKYIDLRT